MLTFKSFFSQLIKKREKITLRQYKKEIVFTIGKEQFQRIAKLGIAFPMYLAR